MTDHLQLVKKACARIEAAGFFGTGYLATSNRVITCEHVIRGVGNGGVVAVLFGDIEITGDVEYSDSDSDFAVILLRKRPTGIEPVKFGSSYESDDPWRAVGYPAIASGQQIPLRGTIEDHNGRDLAGGPAIILYSPMIAAARGAQAQGFSGSPILARNRIIGHLKKIIPEDTTTESPRAEFGLLYACSVNRFCHMLPAEAIDLEQRHEILTKVPELPTNFVPRSNILDNLSTEFLNGKGGGPTGTSPRLGVHGMGGIGKSVVATALARHKRVASHFPDGVYWITLGVDPDITALQLQLIHALGGDETVLGDHRSGRVRLRSLMEGRACLLVLDDAWQATHVQAFDALTAPSQLLLTTRDATLLTTIGAAEYSIDLWGLEQSVELLTKWSDKSFGTALPLGVRRVLDECAGLPLAVAICGAMARDGISWDDLADALKAADLGFLDRAIIDYTYETVLRSLKVSVDFLATTDPPAAKCYESLAIFPPDSAIPEAAVCRLWKHVHRLNDRQARKYLALLERKSLLTLSGTEPHRRVLLHDLQHDYVRSKATDIHLLHKRFVEAYHDACKDGWPNGPDDGYFFQRLPYHLSLSGKLDELDKLLLNAHWMVAKLRASDVASLLTDYDFPAYDKDLALVKEAIRLSAHILGTDFLQTPGQLLGRLLSIGSDRLRPLIESAKRVQGKGIIRPLTACLITPGGPLVRTFAGHLLKVRSLTVTPDYDYVISGADDETVRVWDLLDGKQRYILKTRSNEILAVAVSPDAKYVIASTFEGDVIIWNLRTGRQHAEVFGIRGGPVRALAVLGDDIAMGFDDGSVAILDIESAKIKLRREGDGNQVTALGVAHDQSLVFTGSSEGLIRSLSVKTLGDLCEQRLHQNWITAVSLTPDGKYGMSSSVDGSIAIWGTNTLELRQRIRPNSGRIGAVISSEDGQFAIGGCEDCTIRIWNLATGTETRTLRGHIGEVRALALLSGQQVVSCSTDTTVRMWDIARVPVKEAIAPHQGPVLVMIPTGPDAAFSAGRDGAIRRWELHQENKVINVEHQSADIRAITNLSSHQQLWVASNKWTRDLTATGLSDGMLRAYNSSTGVKLFQRELKWDVALALASNEQTGVIAVGTYSGRVTIIDVQSHKNRLSWSAHDSSIRAIQTTEKGEHVISGSADGTAAVWEIATGRLVTALGGHTGTVTCVAIDRQNQFLFTGSTDGSVKVWSATNYKFVRTILAHEAPVTAMTISDNSRILISCAQNGSIKAWDVSTGEAIGAFMSEAAVLSCTMVNADTFFVGDQWGRVYAMQITV
jgi:WD40 repeat protein